MKYSNLIFIILLLLEFLCSGHVSGQTKTELSGIVTDTTNTAIPNVMIHLISGKDSLIMNTDSLGRFTFKSERLRDIYLTFNCLGYKSVYQKYLFKTEKSHLYIPDIVMHSTAFQLKEVIIKKKSSPVRLLKDTIEFDAKSYGIRENDKVADLLRKLPGVKIDRSGNVTTNGKVLTKLRVNGKDFFTNNVKDYISQLPANIVAKLQIIDDYGDLANFTGIKQGEPEKMLNLVFENDVHKGIFANSEANAGTNDRYSFNLNANLWNASKQLGFSSGTANTNNGSGVQTSSNAGLNFRENLNKNLVISGAYQYSRNKTIADQQSYTETISVPGTVYTNSRNQNSTLGNTHNFNLSLQSNSSNDLFYGKIYANLETTNGEALISSGQSGLIHQDLSSGSMLSLQHPVLNTEFSEAHIFKKSGRVLSFSVSTRNQTNKNQTTQSNHILYYNNNLAISAKDSLLNQKINSKDATQILNAGMTYTEPIGDANDQNVKQNIDLIYVFSLTSATNTQFTGINNGTGLFNRIDSLSNKYTSSFISHNIGLNYRYDNRRLSYSAGFYARPNILSGSYEGKADKLQHNSIILTPMAKINYNSSARNSYNLIYTSSTITPDFKQLQAVPDTRNLQNVIIGNPDLKASTNHSLSISYRNFNTVNRRILLVNFNGNIVQNQVVNNVSLVADTLNSLKYKTSYRNTNGNYSFGPNYNFSIPFYQYYTLELKGSANYNHQASFGNNVKNYGSMLNFSQSLVASMYLKLISLNIDCTYSYQNNSYTLNNTNVNKIQTWAFNLSGQLIISKDLTIGTESAKTISQGYYLPNSSPFLINGSASMTFFKDKTAVIKLSVNDLLNQGNNVNRSTTANSVIETMSNQKTRYFLLSANINLQNFYRHKKEN